VSADSEVPAQLHPPEPVLEIARTLERAGFETWCVGGAVRDALLGHAHLDWDLATAATPPQVQRLFRRTIPVGIEFGTVGVLDRAGAMHEVTTFRRDVHTDGRHAVVEFGASLDDDLARRDFTINAIAYSPTAGQLHDPFGGRADLARRLVRAVGEPEERMREDRLRALRAIRFAGRFAFEIDPDTWHAIVRSAPHLGRLSMERVKQEIEKTMDQVALPSQAFRLWRESGAFGTLLPSLAGISELALATLDALPRPTGEAHPQRRINRITSLVLDLDPAVAVRVLRALRFSNADVAWIAAVVERWHDLAAGLREALLAPQPPDDRQVRRWVARMGRLRVGAVLRVAAARFAAERAHGLPAPSASRVASLYRRAWRGAFRDPVEIGDLAVDGSELIAVGIPAGPYIGKILPLLLDEALEDPARNTREWLLARAVELYRELTS
jgi:tRNA nucleotidyltransferase (CCA-adding enzyme)